MSKTVILLNPMGSDVTAFVNGSLPDLQLLRGSVMAAGDTLYTLPYNNTSGVANINAGVLLLDAKLRSTTGEVLVFGYSEGCQIADKWLTDYGQSAPVSTTDVSFLLIGNACRKYGGFVYQQSVFEPVAYTLGHPEDTPYKVVDFCRQYDPIADFPQAPALLSAMDALGAVTVDINAFEDALNKIVAVLEGNTAVLSAAENALAGLFEIHIQYISVSVADTQNVSFVEGNTTYVWSPTYPLPMLGVVTFPNTDEEYRTQIEKYFTRPVAIPMPAYGSMTSGLSGTPVWTTTPPNAHTTLNLIEQQTNEVRASHEALKKAKPLIRFWMNNPDGSAGMVYIGRVDYDDTIKGSFPFKNNTPTQGVLELRDDNYMAIWLKQLPNNAELKKQVIITVDFYNGKKRWSGMMDKWTVKSKDGVKYLEVTFDDDLKFLQYLLAPPNPALPLGVFQFPRVWAAAGPSKWLISTLIWVNLWRNEGSAWQLPDDPFDVNSWTEAWDMSEWQCLVKGTSFSLDDSSVWTFLSSRMNPVDSVIADSLDDAQLTITYRRIITDDGETANVNGITDVRNGCLVLEIVDNSNATALEGTFLQGTIVDGFVRSIIDYTGGFIEDSFNEVIDDETLTPDEYYQSGFLGTMAAMPWVVIRDNEWTPIESSELSWGPSKNVSAVVGGDNPAIDATAKLLIETTGNLLGMFLMGFPTGTIIEDLVMPFIVGTIAAWDQWKNTGRATELGWIHYLELYQQGAENNSWSLSASTAMRGAFLVGKSETDHLIALRDSWMIPGVHVDIGQRMGSTCDAKGLENIIWVNQLEEMTPTWDNSDSLQPLTWSIKAGKSNRNLTMGERYARLSKKMNEAINNLGFSIISA